MEADREQEARLARLKGLRLRLLQGEISAEEFERERAAVLEGRESPLPGRSATAVLPAVARGAAPGPPPLPERPWIGTDSPAPRFEPVVLAPGRASPRPTPAPEVRFRAPPEKASRAWPVLIAALTAAVVFGAALASQRLARTQEVTTSPAPHPPKPPVAALPLPATPRPTSPEPAPPPADPAPQAAQAPPADPAPARTIQELEGEWVVNPRDGTRIAIVADGPAAFTARYSTPVDCPDCLLRGEVAFERAPPVIRVRHYIGDGSLFGTYELELRSPGLIEGRLHDASGPRGRVRWRRP